MLILIGQQTIIPTNPGEWNGLSKCVVDRMQRKKVEILQFLFIFHIIEINLQI